MTDVIREKKSKDERSLNQMKASLEADFGDMTTLRYPELVSGSYN
jgi:hypothetical protein